MRDHPGNDSVKDVSAGEPQTRYVRAITAGIILGVVVNLWVPFSSYVMHSSRVVFGYLPMAMLLPFVCLVVFVNPLLKFLRRDWALRPGELTIVFIMGLVSSIFPTLGLIGFLLAILATPYYFASVENQWAEHIHAYIPKWAFPSDEGGAMRWFFDGMPEGASLPWQPWVIPLLWWMVIIVALFVVMFCMMVILRKQWVERERLTFPLVELPRALIEGSGEEGVVPRFARSRVFWAGFALSFFVICWNMVTYFYPDFPRIPAINEFRYVRLARSMPALFIRINFFVIAFAFFTNLDVLRSVCLFHILIMCQVGVMQRIGFEVHGRNLWCSFDAATGWQSFGGFIFMVLWGLWMARKHLVDVARKAFRNSADVDDSDEMLSYRAAVWGLILGMVLIVFWLHRMGMEFRVIFVYLFGFFVIHLGVSKIVAQSGLVYVRATCTAQAFTMHTLGTDSLSPASLSSLIFSYAYCCDAKSEIMYASAHTAKTFTGVRTRRRAILTALLLACLTGTVVSLYMTLYLGYKIGAYNFGAWEYQSGNIRIFNDVVTKMRNPVPTDWTRLGFLAAGAVATAVIMALHYNLTWWPLHPVGFTIGGVWPIRASAFAIFLAWVCKFVVVKLGGISLYRKARPFFVGMLVGYVLAVGVSLAVDAIWFPGHGHMVHHW